jgi:hypothetical protein
MAAAVLVNYLTLSAFDTLGISVDRYGIEKK